MKALKSELAQKILSDPNGKKQLRTYLADKAARVGSVRFEVQVDHTTKRYTAKIVPKAA